MTSDSSFEEPKLSPMMVQWQACKEAAGDAVLFFRMGDFYEAFYDDALLLSKELDLTLTRRQDIPMSGVPFHTGEAYIDKLVSKGFRVAVAEQTEDPKKTKGLVKREVVRVVTPGTLINSGLLSEKSNNFFASVAKTGQLFGLSWLDLTTGDFFASEFSDKKTLLNEIHRLQPAELLISEKFKCKQPEIYEDLYQAFGFSIIVQADWHFEHRSAHDFLTAKFKVFNLDGFGLQGMAAAINAAGALLKHIQINLCLSVDHIQEILPVTAAHYMSLDKATLRHLELTSSIRDGSRKNTLSEILDKTCTPMGARLIHRWIKHPLLCTEEIRRRQEGIQDLLDQKALLGQLRTGLQQVKDIERLIMKIGSGYATPRDLSALMHSFDPVGSIKGLLEPINALWIRAEADLLDPLSEMNRRISIALVDEPPLRIGEGKVFKEGYNSELDDLRSISRDGKAWIVNYQTKLREELGIKTLKVGFNRMTGYYIEVSKGQSDRMPDTFTRRQTLVNAERFLSPELKNYESKVLTAEERIDAVESELFFELRMEIAGYLKQVLAIAHALAKLDCISGLAEAAFENDYRRPIVDESMSLFIEGGRHPVVERVYKQEKFISNDTYLDSEERRLMLITGPNMAGKSTYLRQVALIVIMAQIGSYVPAQKAHIGIIDKIFTRIGAGDDLSKGQSTFMVEMTETANILNNVTPRSLVILDEIGRGTGTYDGISIAWSISEYLLGAEGQGAKTLFATHYLELTELEKNIPGAINYYVPVHESDAGVVFLRRILKGSADKSYGIHVASLAGMPGSVIRRSKEILEHLESNSSRKSAFEPPKKRPSPVKVKVSENRFQLSLFGEFDAT